MAVSLGTVTAVIISLYLARRDKSVRLEVSAGHRLILTQGVKKPRPEYLLIKVVNIGQRGASNEYRLEGRLVSSNAVQTTIMDGMSSTISVRLKDGQEANFFIPLNEQTNWLQTFARDFLQSSPVIRSRFVKVWVSTSIGKTFEQNIETGLRNLLVQAAKKLPTSPSIQPTAEKRSGR